MAYSTIPKGSLYTNTKLYTGNGSTNAITGVGFQPSLVWLKERSDSGAPILFDAVRGATKFVRSSDSAAEVTAADTLTAFNSDGFTLGADAGDYSANQNSKTYASWNWKANGQGSSNTAGTINTTYTSANTTSGFSIIEYVGNGTANATIGHGLGVEPSMILFKNLASNNWIVYQKSMGTGQYLTLNLTNSRDSASGAWCTPSATLIQLNQVFGATNTSGATYIAYAFADVKGYSNVGGSYTGNGNADGTFIYTGFSPSFVMTKRTDGTGGWFMQDDKRLGYNYANYRLFADDSAAESTASRIDLLSNGFKCRDNDGNGNGFTYIYMAFAENPFVATSGTTAVPVTAR